MYYSYVLQQAYLSNDSKPLFSKLLSTINVRPLDPLNTPLQSVLMYLNDLPSTDGFIYENYTPDGTAHLNIPRMYYTGKNGQFIDKVRLKIETWFQQGLITENEYFILIACLIETVPFYANILGVYGAFHKKWDPRALKEMSLREIEIISNGQDNIAYNTDSKMLLDTVSADIFYLIHPITNANMRLTITYWKRLLVMINLRSKAYRVCVITQIKSQDFARNQKCLMSSSTVKNGRFKHLVLSYNSEGLMNKEQILEMMNAYGTVELVDFDYLRFKSNSNGLNPNKKYIKEQLYLLSK